ncbi:MAG TPA: CinA family nicotinamide mononucleotide deamidase-related protein [Flavisolibacter sp.]|jgi:nicotinamide-nucleotide amidase|nr:CinA family nicotinamide mononucleotide deamidase-related protein [Flavisolibacter sp.]
MVNASIITIGDELLIGQVIDTNSAWISQELNKIGIWVKRRVAVGDVREDIWNALDEESRHSHLVIITGGLGPTADDITKPLLCNYFNAKPVINEEVLKHVTYLFENIFRRPLTESNRKQAEVPDTCQVLFNKLGTAPGMWFEKQGKVFISLPGVPQEMKGIMSDIVLSRLRDHFTMEVIAHRTLLTAGVGESVLADHIKEWESQLPGHIKLAYLPNYGMVRLRLTGRGTDQTSLENEMQKQFDEVKKIVAEWLVTDEDLTMPQVISTLLKERKKILGTAESCTGGYIAHLITRESGASDKYNGTIVSYSNAVKKGVLKVSPETIDSVGAVSEETVLQMARGAIEVLKTDYAIATSGIMGPDGGTPQKPVGTVWIAVANKKSQTAHKFQFRFDRMRNIELTANNALNMLRKFILSEEDAS